MLLATGHNCNSWSGTGWEFLKELQDDISREIERVESDPTGNNGYIVCEYVDMNQLDQHYNTKRKNENCII